MKVIVRLYRDSQMLEETEFPYEKLGKTKMESFLQGTYKLSAGYEITYVDSDGDEITVEFDDDYEVAKLTHNGDSLCFNVKISDHEWLAQFGSQSIKEEPKQSLHQSIGDKTQVIASIDNPSQSSKVQHQKGPEQPKQTIQQKETQVAKVEEKLSQSKQERDLKPLVNQEQTKQPIRTQISDKQRENKSQSQKDDELLLPMVQTKKEPESISPISSLDEPEVKKESKKVETKDNKQSKKVKKQKKETLPKQDKNNLSLSEKQLNKTIKKQVFKLLPQIAEQLKKLNEEDQVLNGLNSAKIKKIIFLNCSRCEQKLEIPFYINSSHGIKFCQSCQRQDTSTISLIKIRDPQMIQKLLWAQPLCHITKEKEITEVKFFTEMKKQLQNQLKEKMDRRIKQAKAEVKNEKMKQKIKKNKEEQKKIETENQLGSNSSSV